MRRPIAVQGATMICPAGSTPSTLIVNSPTLTLEGKPIATIMDFAPVANVPPFGVCAIKGGPCMPAPAGPWQALVPQVMLLPTIFPPLLEGATLQCTIGGTIMLMVAGQSTMAVAAPMMNACTPGLGGPFLNGMPRLVPMDQLGSGGGNPCWQDASACGGNLGGPGVCGAAAGACGAAASGVTGCGAAAGACGVAGTGVEACGANVGACGAAASGANACGAAVGACGAAASGANACGAALGACGAAAGGATACGAQSACLADACGADGCAVDVTPGDACAVDGCLVDAVPVVPLI